MAVSALDALHPEEKVARYRARGWWSDETIDGLLAGHVTARRDALAVLDPPDKEQLCGLPARRLTWAELGACVDRLAAQLLSRGIGVGDVLGVQLPNVVELVATYLAAIRIGAAVSPLPVQHRESEVAAAARLASFAAFVTLPRFGERALAEAAGEVLDVPVLAFRRDLTLDPASDVERTAVDAHRATFTTDPNRCVTIYWTSGTEGTPKAVPRCHYDWLAVAKVTQEAPGLTAADVILNPFPLVNMASIAGTFLPWLRLGARLVLHHPVTLPVYLGQIAQERVTYTLAPPAVLTMLLQREDMLAKADLGSLRAIGSGAAPLPPSMVRGWQERFGISVLNMFGSNEGVCLLSTAADFPDPELRAQFFPRYGSPGVTWSCRAMDGITARLVDLETGAEITEPGVRGELVLDGPTVFAGYLAGAGADPFDERGGLRSGDVFQLTGDRAQYLHHVDRAKDLIIRGGMNIAPVEVENLIVAHPAVADAAVIGYPDDVLGEKACAVIVRAPGSAVTPDDILKHLAAQRIASYKLPERFEFVEELPRNPVGKILKRQLRERFGAGTPS